MWMAENSQMRKGQLCVHRIKSEEKENSNEIHSWKTLDLRDIFFFSSKVRLKERLRISSPRRRKKWVMRLNLWCTDWGKIIIIQCKMMTQAYFPIECKLRWNVKIMSQYCIEIVPELFSLFVRSCQMSEGNSFEWQCKFFSLPLWRFSRFMFVDRWRAWIKEKGEFLFALFSKSR